MRIPWVVRMNELELKWWYFLSQFELAWNIVHMNRGGSNSYKDGVSYTHDFCTQPPCLHNYGISTNHFMRLIMWKFSKQIVKFCAIYGGDNPPLHVENRPSSLVCLANIWKNYFCEYSKWRQSSCLKNEKQWTILPISRPYLNARWCL